MRNCMFLLLLLFVIVANAALTAGKRMMLPLCKIFLQHHRIFSLTAGRHVTLLLQLSKIAVEDTAQGLA